VAEGAFGLAVGQLVVAQRRLGLGASAQLAAVADVVRVAMAVAFHGAKYAPRVIGWALDLRVVAAASVGRAGAYVQSPCAPDLELLVVRRRRMACKIFLLFQYDT
jgi:hypothetical protein